MKTKLAPPSSPALARSAYSQAISYDLGDHQMIYLAGQIAIDDNGKIVEPENTEAQTRFLFERIKALLAFVGATLDDLVKVQVFLTRLDEFDRFSAVRNAYLGESRPASTVVGVTGLVRPGCCVEIDATAIRRRP